MFIQFHVTGLTTNNKRFKRIFDGDMTGYMYAMGINLYRGSVWGVMVNGKRKLLKSIYN